MYRFLNYIIDFLFPPSAEELELRAISPEKFIHIAPKATATEFPFITSLFSYKDPLVRELIWQIKYKKNKHAVTCAAFALEKKLSKDSLIIPIPISKQRRKERGYNQCELILDALGSNTQKDYSLLIRSKHIEKQTLKNRNERIENTKNIFEVTKLVDQKIIIFDDVTTTGSTLKEAQDALLKAGYTDIKAITLAH